MQALVVAKGGTLDLHGKLFAPTWTRLAQVQHRLLPHCGPLTSNSQCHASCLLLPQTATAGSTSLKLQDAVPGWEAGQQVVVTTTIWKDEQVLREKGGRRWGKACMPGPERFWQQLMDRAARLLRLTRCWSATTFPAG
jgi:hypothetical protein